MEREGKMATSPSIAHLGQNFQQRHSYPMAVLSQGAIDLQVLRSYEKDACGGADRDGHSWARVMVGAAFLLLCYEERTSQECRWAGPAPVYVM